MVCGLSTSRILDYLDNCVIHNPGCSFMDLEHGYFATANSRLTLLGDGKHWGIVFEKSGYQNRASSIGLELNFFGCCLRNLEPGGAYHQFNYNAKSIDLVSADALDDVAADVDQLSPSARSVRLRDGDVDLPARLEDYERWVPGISEREPREVKFEDLARYLTFEHEGLCRATDAELSTCLPESVEPILRLDEWHHRSYSVYDDGAERTVMGDAPSSYETFPMLAEVLVSGDPGAYRPSLPPTNHWKNWPEAGGL